MTEEHPYKTVLEKALATYRQEMDAAYAAEKAAKEKLDRAQGACPHNFPPLEQSEPEPCDQKDSKSCNQADAEEDDDDADDKAYCDNDDDDEKNLWVRCSICHVEARRCRKSPNGLCHIGSTTGCADGKHKRSCIDYGDSDRCIYCGHQEPDERK